MRNIIRIDDTSRVGEVRRAAEMAAANEGLTELASSQFSIVATEIAGNIVKHAGGGEIQLLRLSSQGVPGVELLAIDRGPGMADVEQCFGDGYSTAGTSGTGLGAIARLSTEFDVYSQPDKGTVLMARMLKQAAPANPALGSVVVPVRGENVSGDAWRMRRNGGGGLLMMMADGLGHGLLAADASTAAAAAFESHTAVAPAEVLEALHRALRGTRGAAIAVANVNPEKRSVLFAGIGNIAGVIVGGPKTLFMVSHNGTAGHEARRIQEFQYSLPEHGLVILHSDGLTTNWNLDSYPGLVRRHPSVIAGVLYRDAGRPRDDAGIVVLRPDPK